MRDAFPPGMRGNSAKWESLPYDVVGYHRRTTALTGASSEVGYVRIDNVPMRDGFLYLFVVPALNLSESAATNIPRANIRVNASGTATTSSGIMGYARFNQENASFTNVAAMMGAYNATADGSLSVLVSVVRDSGAGTVGIFASSTNPFDLIVLEVGQSLGSSGTDL